MSSFDNQVHVEESGNFVAYNEQRELENELQYYGIVAAMEQFDCGPVSFDFLNQ